MRHAGARSDPSSHLSCETPQENSVKCQARKADGSRLYIKAACQGGGKVRTHVPFKLYLTSVHVKHAESRLRKAQEFETMSRFRGLQPCFSIRSKAVLMSDFAKVLSIQA